MNTRRLLIPVFACLISTTALADVEINETNFPDANFRNWALKQSYGEDGVLTDAEIADVKYINVAIKEIQSLKGIEFFTEITKLSCPSNQLTELDLSKNTKLKNVFCVDNQLTSLDLSNNTDLKELDCHENQLKTLNVSTCSQLLSLDVSDNHLTTLDVSNKNLWHLSCENNQLTELNVSGCTSLSDLDCSCNQLTSIDVSTCAGLRSLACVQNLLTTLDVTNNSRLQSLECAANKLTRLDLSGCTELELLSCCNNQIKGEAMDSLVANLPTRNDFPGTLTILNKDFETEQNEMSSAQVAIAKSKGWEPLYWDAGWKEYAGYDVFNGLNSPRAAAPNAQCIYNLSGHRITRPRKGMYIIDGRKVVVK